jgi:ubiquitin-conjugating enzyme E2 Q
MRTSSVACSGGASTIMSGAPSSKTRTSATDAQFMSRVSGFPRSGDSGDSAAVGAGEDRGEHHHNVPTSASSGEDDGGVIAAPANLNLQSSMEAGGPAEIPPEPSGEGAEDAAAGHDGGDDESEYEYEEEDDAAFSGFLVDHAPLASAQSESAPDANRNAGSAESPARIRDEEESIVAVAEPRKKWREPSREAVSMSLRAEQEKTGSKRRLAQDLYRIMNQDTEEAGFAIEPKSEDNMDHWTIKLFKFDQDSNLAKDMAVLGFEHIELEMTFPNQYPFEPPFVRVVRPRFKRQTGFVMNGALCMELLTKEGWNPVNDIESVIVSIRSLLVVGDGRLQAAHEMSDSKYQARLKAAAKDGTEDPDRKRQKKEREADDQKPPKEDVGSYSLAEAHAAYSHLSDYHKKKGWDSSGWWARKG